MPFTIFTVLSLAGAPPARSRRTAKTKRLARRRDAGAQVAAHTRSAARPTGRRIAASETSPPGGGEFYTPRKNPRSRPSARPRTRSGRWIPERESALTDDGPERRAPFLTTPQHPGGKMKTKPKNRPNPWYWPYRRYYVDRLIAAPRFAVVRNSDVTDNITVFAEKRNEACETGARNGRPHPSAGDKLPRLRRTPENARPPDLHAEEGFNREGGIPALRSADSGILRRPIRPS